MSDASPHINDTLIAGCKVNLNLRITKVLPNGWHALDSIFIPLSKPYDELELMVENTSQGLHIYCDTLGIDPKNNTLTKVYQLFSEATGFSPSLSISLKKGIPHGAGLGGGSSDAAIFLQWLQKHCPNPLPEKTLIKLATQVGADVPFFLKNTPCRATGLGEKLQPISLSNLMLSGNTLLLLCPHIHISTPWAYKAWDLWIQNQKTLLTKDDPLTKKTSQDRSSTFRTYSDWIWLTNDFEFPIFAVYPYLRKLKEQLLQFGARAAILSGSGASICGLFKEQKTALTVAEYFQHKNITVFSHILL